MSNVNRDDENRPLYSRGDQSTHADQPTQDLADTELPNLYGRSTSLPPARYDSAPDQQEPENPILAASANAWFTITKFNQFLYWLLAVIEVWLLLRFFLKLVGAAPSNPFASFLYGTTNPLLLPFSTILPATYFGPVVLEWSTLVGMLVYALVTVAIVRFLRLLVTTPRA